MNWKTQKYQRYERVRVCSAYGSSEADTADSAPGAAVPCDADNSCSRLADTVKVFVLVLLANVLAGIASAVEQRYRGDYTLGHEVNTFCPAINSQCYWLSPETGQLVRARLKQIYQARSTGLYEPVCVVVSGEIDRDTARTGFAADTHGLIKITRVFGDCNSSRTLTHGDLMHRRWVMLTGNNRFIDRSAWPVTPSLDFGERLFVEGGDGCRQFRGFAALDEDRIIFENFQFGENKCSITSAAPGLFSITGNWTVRIRDSRFLSLEQEDAVLIFERDDWR